MARPRRSTSLRCLGKEYWVLAPGASLQRYRASSHQKVVSNLPRNEPISDRQLREFLVYGIFPGGYGRTGWGEEGMRATTGRSCHSPPAAPARLGAKAARRPRRRATRPIERFSGGTGGKPLCLAVHSRWGAKV